MLRYLLFESIHTKQVNLISYHAIDVQDVVFIAENHSHWFSRSSSYAFFKITKFAKTSACMFLFTNIVLTKTPSICFNQHIVNEKFSVVFLCSFKATVIQYNTIHILCYVILYNVTLITRTIHILSHVQVIK